MQLHKNTFAMALAGLAMMSFSACNDAEYSPLENQAFFAETKTNANIAQKITVEDKDFTPATFHVQLSSPAEGETKFAIEFDEAALKKYNEDNFTNYKLLPTTNYEMPTKEVTFQDGETLSGDIVVNVKPFTQEQKDNADKFALPLKLVSKDGKKDILNSGGAMMLLFDKVVRQAVPTYSAWCPFQFKMKEDFNSTQWTVEFCVNIDQDRKSTRLNSSHANISYAVFCLKKKKQTHNKQQKSNEISKHELTNKSYRTHRDKSCDNSHGLII